MKKYETEIKNYLARKGITNYTITEKEQGVIPMTAYQFGNTIQTSHQHRNSGRLV